MRLLPKCLVVTASLLILVGCRMLQPQGEEASALRSRVDALVEPFVENEYFVGAVVALIRGDDVHVFGYGVVSKKSPHAPDGDTVFEIGSITKVFTALLLADMVERGHVKMDDPVKKLLPHFAFIPRKGGRDITLADLITHTSGLPRKPANFKPKDPCNPYADYTTEMMYEFLSTCQLSRRPGAGYEYSNLGVGLLGHALARREGVSYETLLVNRICAPLRMKDTSIRLSAGRRSRLAQGYDVDGNPVPNWDVPTLAGAAAIRSTANDMARFLKANMGTVETPLFSAMAATHTPRKRVPSWPRMRVALGWHVKGNGKNAVIWHNGQTGGYRSFAGFNKDRKVGVVILSSSTATILDRLGFRLIKLLLGRSVEPLKFKEPVAVAQAVLEQYVGKYQISPDVVAKVSRVGRKLVFEVPGEGRTFIYPESETRFFLKADWKAKVTFVKDEKGRVAQAVFRDGEKEETFEKLE